MNVAVVFLISFCASSASSQSRAGAPEPDHAAVTIPTVFVGRVLTPESLPARGAVVVSSVGGEAVTRADGTFELAAELPLDAQFVEVTAALDLGSRGSLAASVRILPAAFTATTSVGTLQLVPDGECRPRWIATFGGLPGTDDDVTALAALDDGRGPALFAGGVFQIAGGVRASGVARWSGARWTALGGGIGGGGLQPVHAFAVYDDGSGPALHVAGSFTTAGGAPANRIAKWDGSSWSALGSGTNGTVYALAVFDDGSGPALYAGGTFTIAGGVAANRIARWNGSSWSALGDGVHAVTQPSVRAFVVFDDGSGPALYIAGRFGEVDGVPARGIARWDGTSWSALANLNTTVLALAVFDDGTGEKLYAGGWFETASGVTVNHIARWDGTSWSALGSGTNDGVLALTVYDDGGGSVLVASGSFSAAGGFPAQHVAAWDGTGWEEIGGGLDFAVPTIAVLERGADAQLFAGGSFSGYVARLDGTAWADVGTASAPEVHALGVAEVGDTEALFVAGAFTDEPAEPVARILRWDGADLSPIGSTLGGNSDQRFSALASFDDGSGPTLFAGGSFTQIHDVQARSIARWNGTGWSALGTGMGGTPPTYVRALVVHDDGGGPALYAGGDFISAGGVLADRIARWDGASWSTLGSGLDLAVYALAVFDDGAGPALYAGGDFSSAGGNAASGVARWDGTSWAALGSGLSSSFQGNLVRALTVFDDGSGPALYAAGYFDLADGAPANSIARWDGASWSPLSSGLDASVQALAVLDDGSGPALYAGGSFTSAGGVAANSIARWDGASWSPLSSGLGHLALALAVFDDGAGPALFAGGTFRVSPAGDSYLAKWTCGRTVARAGF